MPSASRRLSATVASTRLGFGCSDKGREDFPRFPVLWANGPTQSEGNIQEEREENVEETEEVEAHKRFVGPSDEPGRASDEEDEDVEAHRMRGPEEFGKRY